MSIDELNCGKALSGGDDLERDASDGQLAAGCFRALRVLLADLLELGDVGLVVLRDVRDRGPRFRETLRRFLTNRSQRHPFDVAPLAEIGQWRCRHAPAATEDDSSRGRMHVVDRDAPAGPCAFDCRQVDAEFARVAAR